jgi:transcriptional regulator with XRE-family HTH domain
MPAKVQNLTSDQLGQRVQALGALMRQRRKAMGVSMTTAAEAAGVSRVTWHRMEKGEVSVTIGAWFNALAALGLEFGLGLGDEALKENPAPAGHIPVAVPLARYPQLAALAWQVKGVAEITPRQAFDIYQRNQRHIDRETLSPEEADLIEALEKVFAGV